MRSSACSDFAAARISNPIERHRFLPRSGRAAPVAAGRRRIERASVPSIRERVTRFGPYTPAAPINSQNDRGSKTPRSIKIPHYPPAIGRGGVRFRVYSKCCPVVLHTFCVKQPTDGSRPPSRSSRATRLNFSPSPSGGASSVLLNRLNANHHCHRSRRLPGDWMPARPNRPRPPAVRRSAAACRFISREERRKITSCLPPQRKTLVRYLQKQVRVDM